jgi:hypothetical protein
VGSLPGGEYSGGRVREEEEGRKEMEGKDWKRRETMKKERYSCTIDLYSNLNHTVYDVRN